MYLNKRAGRGDRKGNKIDNREQQEKNRVGEGMRRKKEKQTDIHRRRH